MTHSEAVSYIPELCDRIHAYNEAYYQQSVSLISDYEFDQLLAELIALENQFPDLASPYSPSQRVGGGITKQFATVVHQRPMLSLGNTYSKSDLIDWDLRNRKALESSFEYLCEQKFDGVAISLHYEHGKLVQAVTRGDGSQGDDITLNAKTIQSIPLTLKGNDWPVRFEVRGEVYFTWSAFEKLNQLQIEKGENVYANPRNTASGTLKLQDSKEVARRKLSCFAYFLLGEELKQTNHAEALEALHRWGFSVSPTWEKCKNIEEVWNYIEKWETERHQLPLATDGIVIKINDFEQQEFLGLTAKSPRWAISYKYKAASVCTQLNEVSYQVGRTGAVTPVANMKPILLAGTIVKRATLHNADELDRLDLHDQDWVWIEKGGEIIPKVISVELSKRNAFSKKIEFPKNCPECGTPLQRKPEESAWYCLNEKNCPPQIKGRLEHFIHRKAMNIDSLGEGKIELLFEKGLLSTPADLYKLEYSNLFGLEKTIEDPITGKQKKIGFREKTTENLLQALEASKKVPFHKVLFAMGIRYVGSTVSEKLAEAFGSVEALRQATTEQLTQVPEIGERIAQSVQEWFQDADNLQMLQSLKDAGLQFEVETPIGVQKTDRLMGKSFVVSGVFSLKSRSEMESLIKTNGGKLLSGVSSKLDYLVAGENMGPSKLAKATELGIQILRENEFLNLISD